MAATDPPATGLLNLEKELVCFICTEILYQPLTLLDCLHTFCGSCLKEWFSHQHRKALQSHATLTAYPYTCPTCRAPVKDVQHNAMINTLLDMFLAANPGKDRPAEEKAQMAQIYKPGDQIMPKVDSHRRREHRRREDEMPAREPRGASRSFQERSRQDQQPYSSSTDGRLNPRPMDGNSRSRERRDRTARSREADRHERRQRLPSTEATVPQPGAGGSSSSPDLSASLSPPEGSPRHPNAVEARQRGARTVAHQASLISLVSASESGTGTGESLNEAQLMQEILAEGLLDGINVEQLTEAEQDELSERIAERYRQLHPERVRRAASDVVRTDLVSNETRQLEVQVEEADRQPRQSSRSSQRQQTHPSPRSSRSVTIGGIDGRPPSAFPQSASEQTLTPPQATGYRPRASNESGRRETSATRAERVSEPRSSHNVPAARSATDLSNRPQSTALASQRRPQTANPPRSNTEPRTPPRASQAWQSTGRQFSGFDCPDSAARHLPPEDDLRSLMSSVNTAPVPTSIPTSDPAIAAAEPLASSQAVASTTFEEPCITCARCSREGIQYEVHKHCPSCKLDLCLRCYRAARGCNHWYGFGHGAMFKFEASQPPNRSSQAIELPHLLIGRRYQRPPLPATQDDHRPIATASDPAMRLQEGNFCDRCGKFANECFWSCDYCNEGEWGFCNDCVNTNHCCSHPLLPVAYRPRDSRSSTSRPGTAGTGAGAPATLTPFSVAGRLPSPAQSAASSTTSMNANSLKPDFVPLVITTHCDICSRPVSPEEVRYHCPSHPTPTPEDPDQKGDFDICSACYHGFVKTKQIKRDDGPDGWRLCPSGHRMIEVTFEHEQNEGQRRVILRDLVGGMKMSDADVVAWKLAHTQLNATAAQRGSNTDQSAAFTVPGLQGQWVWREDSSGTRRATRLRTATLTNTSKFPPDGGFGKICRALWSYYPEEGDDGKGELMFPKYAQLWEVEDINEDWSFGVYAGDMGLFPTVYVREIA